MAKLTPQMRHQRKSVVKLLMLSFSVFLMSLWGIAEGGKDSVEALAEKSRLANEAAKTPKVPKTWSPGSRTVVPPAAVASDPSEVEDVGAAVDDALMAATPAVQDCLTQWWMMDPALEGEVRFELTVGATGLVDAQVLDHDGVHKGSLACLGAALGTVDWPVSAESLTETVALPVFGN